MPEAPIEVTVRGIQRDAEFATAATVLLGPRNHAESGLIAVHVASGDAHALHHELQGECTTRAQAVGLFSRVAAMLGGEVVAAHLFMVHPGLVTAALEVKSPLGRLGVDTEPGQALAVAVCLGIPLLVDSALFTPALSGQDHVTGALHADLTSFLASLDLSGLPDPSS